MMQVLGLGQLQGQKQVLGLGQLQGLVPVQEQVLEPPLEPPQGLRPPQEQGQEQERKRRSFWQ
jgi:hypothetical protein